MKQGKDMFKWPADKEYYGNIYDGDWKNDIMDGKGVMRYPDGSVMYEVCQWGHLYRRMEIRSAEWLGRIEGCRRKNSF